MSRSLQHGASVPPTRVPWYTGGWTFCFKLSLEGTDLVCLLQRSGNTLSLWMCAFALACDVQRLFFVPAILDARRDMEAGTFKYHAPHCQSVGQFSFAKFTRDVVYQDKRTHCRYRVQIKNVSKITWPSHCRPLSPRWRRCNIDPAVQRLRLVCPHARAPRVATKMLVRLPSSRFDFRSYN